MNKILNILILLIFISSFGRTQEITKDFLTKHKFENSRCSMAFANIIFNKDNSYSIEISSLGPKYKDVGTYSISDSIIKLIVQ